jgi:hypothetical protein
MATAARVGDFPRSAATGAYAAEIEVRLDAAEAEVVVDPAMLGSLGRVST